MSEIQQPGHFEEKDNFKNFPLPNLHIGDHLYLPGGLGSPEITIIADGEIMNIEKGEINLTMFRNFWDNLAPNKQSLTIRMNRKLEETE